MKNGFTLIEPTTVTAMIAVLASIAIPKYQTYILRTHVQTDSAVAKAPIERAIVEYISNVGVLPSSGFTDLAKAGFVQNNGDPHTSASLATKNIQSIDWNGLELTLKFTDNHQQDSLSGKTIRFALDNSTASSQFSSSGGTLSAHLRP